MKTKYIIGIYGNPGSGKSTICNTLIGLPYFKAGISFGSGLTHSSRTYTFDDKTIIDTPGLDDLHIKEQASREIEMSLKNNDNYIVVFVVTTESGRIRPSDINTINTVLDAIKCDIKYGIIINQLSKNIMNQVVDNSQWEASLSKLNSEPTDLLMVPREENCVDQSDALLCSKTKNQILTWIDKIGPTFIDKDNVKMNYELVHQLQTRIQLLESEIKDLTKQIDIAKQGKTYKPKPFYSNFLSKISNKCSIM